MADQESDEESDKEAVPAQAGPGAAPPPGAPRTINYKFNVGLAQPMARLNPGIGPAPAAKPVRKPAIPPPIEPPPPSVPEPHFDPMPDLPEGFGYKVNWFAVRAPDPSAVLEALDLAPVASANWASGLAAAYRWSSSAEGPGWVFASPTVDGWVLLVGSSLPYPVDAEGRHGGVGQAFDAVFARLKRSFEDVQFFGSHRVVGFVAWARALRGVPERIFSFGEGDVSANVGEQSPEEAALGFPRLDGLDLSAATDRISDLLEKQQARHDALVASGVPYREARARSAEGEAMDFPDEQHVTALAGLWSVDPTRLDEPDRALAPGVGLVARLPQDLMRAPG